MRITLVRSLNCRVRQTHPEEIKYLNAVTSRALPSDNLHPYKKAAEGRSAPIRLTMGRLLQRLKETPT